MKLVSRLLRLLRLTRCDFCGHDRRCTAASAGCRPYPRCRGCSEILGKLPLPSPGREVASVPILLNYGGVVVHDVSVPFGYHGNLQYSTTEVCVRKQYPGKGIPEGEMEHATTELQKKLDSLLMGKPDMVLVYESGVLVSQWDPFGNVTYIRAEFSLAHTGQGGGTSPAGKGHPRIGRQLGFSGCMVPTQG